MSDENIPAVRQENNRVSGSLAGRDIVMSPETKTPLRRMAERYQPELENDCGQKEFIEELQDYMKRVPGNGQRSLEVKLSAASRDDLIQKAKFLKEKFSKKLYKHTFSPAAQNIFVHILSMINCSFELKIKPMIYEKSTPREIDRAIFEEILQAVYNEIGDSELGINMEYIQGMLYYLTGNCYIDWD